MNGPGSGCPIYLTESSLRAIHRPPRANHEPANTMDVSPCLIKFRVQTVVRPLQHGHRAERDPIQRSPKLQRVKSGSVSRSR